MRVMYQGLEAEVSRRSGVSILDTFGLTLIIAPGGCVSVDGVPLVPLVPRLLPARRTFLIDAGAAAQIIMIKIPPITRFNFKGFQVEP